LPKDETPGQRVRRLRTERGLSQQEIAGPGVSSSHVCAVEIVRREATPTVLRLIATRLGVLPEYLETGRSETTTDRLAEAALQHSDGALWIVLTRDGVTLTWQYAGETNRLERPQENITEGLLVVTELNEELDRLAVKEAQIWARRDEISRERRQPE
jgi:transcriptional regulator with XRE-family HTH domain